MQDFNYLATNCMELTIEVSCIKYPLASKLPPYHHANLPPLLALMWEVHTGVKGIVRASQNGKLNTVHGARICVWNLKNKTPNRHCVTSGELPDRPWFVIKNMLVKFGVIQYNFARKLALSLAGELVARLINVLMMS